MDPQAEEKGGSLLHAEKNLDQQAIYFYNQGDSCALTGCLHKLLVMLLLLLLMKELLRLPWVEMRQRVWAWPRTDRPPRSRPDRSRRDSSHRRPAL